jgi:hypothetical protein
MEALFRKSLLLTIILLILVYLAVKLVLFHEIIPIIMNIFTKKVLIFIYKRA